ncbi:MAG: O-antigen ligase family protein [Ruminococcaceae bacterium]|nr:O-antigen ligase family protein [Oscillospiraceae bacterium]
MASKKPTKQSKKTAVLTDPYPLGWMHDWIARIYMWILVALFPLMMGAAKYTAITVYKRNTFYTITYIALVFLALAYLLYNFTKETPRKKLDRATVFSAPFFAEFALVAYWLFMAISCVLAYDSDVAFEGLPDRDNGFIIQTLYIAVFFILSRRLLARQSDAYVFVWGGNILSLVTMLHFFGVDLYGVALTIANKSGTKTTVAYDGPYFGDHFDAQLAVTKKAANFMGPVGNINLGSYILTVCCIVAACLFINNIRNKWDKYNLFPICSFALILWTELNMNTSAGIVALAAAAAAIPLVLCTSFTHLRRILTVYGTACLVLLFDHTLVDVILCGEPFGSDGALYLIAAVVLALAALAVYFLAEKKNVTVRPALFRSCAAALMVLALAAVIGYSLYVSAPKTEVVAASSSASSAAIAEKPTPKTKVTFSNEDLFNELGQILRGNFNDKLGHGRLFTWKLCLSVIQLRPLLGYGPDNFKNVTYLQGDYYTKQINDFFGDRSLDKAHNEFLDILLCNGFIGLICFVGFLGALLYYAFRRADKGGVAPALGVAVIAYMVHAFFGYQLPLQSGVMWALLGLCAAFIRSEQKEESEKAFEGRENETPLWSRNIVFGALIILTTGVVAGCMQLIIAAVKGGIAPLATRENYLEPYTITAASLAHYLVSNFIGIVGIALMIVGTVIIIREAFRREEA